MVGMSDELVAFAVIIAKEQNAWKDAAEICMAFLA